MIEELDQKILLLLLEDPFRSVNDVTKSLEVSFKTVNNRINNMKEKGIIFKDLPINDPILGNRVKTHVSAYINTNNLGLIRHHVIFGNIQKDVLKKLELFCDIHPYTTYRSRFINNSFGLYAQFVFPPILHKEMLDLYETICEKYQISTKFIISTDEYINIHPNLFYWKNLKNYWNIINKRETENLSMFEFFWNNYLEEKENGLIVNKVETMKPMNMKLSPLHAKIIRELTINGNISISDLSTYYDRDKSTISRHVSNIKAKYIRHAVLRFNPTEFDFNTFRIIIGKINSTGKITKEAIQEFISTQKFPFYGYMIFSKDEYLLFVTTNNIHYQQIYNFMWENSTVNTVQTFELVFEKSMRYRFYNGNFLEDGRFNTDRNYYFEDPLTQLNKMG
ncbi:MAG: Lrp/AsnC family transcriptional regulator, partial [Candidatus Heimdallarchaeota archaeon]|nr:Lrp/AsnC family transcriptional regulator [Candidatus Heimdallarchaeota archaeon]MDH5646785.1 Lrp/AsnC family transcriptional regulator [Candidatus Heimdallarchaeota archaeon]